MHSFSRNFAARGNDEGRTSFEYSRSFFVLSELRTAFQMGFLIFIPFIIVDFIVASSLMSMGMMMMPPVVISMPFKLLLFVFS